MSDERLGNPLQTRSGIKYYPLDPRASEVRIRDIAHSLSMLCRYNGHCNAFYSVAEHSVWVSMQVKPEHQLSALLHDASEAYCSDVPRPLKLNLPGYADIEQMNWLAIAERFNLPRVMHDSIHVADNAVLLAEKQQIVDPHFEWDVPGKAAHVFIKCLPPTQAYELFINRFVELF